jgi:hypothetical protein
MTLPDIEEILVDEDETPYCFSFEGDGYEDGEEEEEDDGGD